MTHKRGEFVVLKDGNWIKRQKVAGSIVAKTHQEIFRMIHGTASNLTLKQLGEVADTIIRKNDCIPTFLGYNGFPSVICTSINKEIVHGFTRNIELKPGDVIKVDVGATFEGAIGDCACTYVYGKTTEQIGKLLISCQDALYDAIKLVQPGRRIGELGKSIFQKSKDTGFGCITMFGGHGIDYDKLHAVPFVPNKAKADEGVTIQSGMSIAIEPMFVIGSNTNTKIMKDKWTVLTNDIGCHFEHSVTLDENGNTHIMTDHGIFVRDFL